MSKERAALITVANKLDVERIGDCLAPEHIITTPRGGTFDTLEAAGIEVVPVEEFAGDPVLTERAKTMDHLSARGLFITQIASAMSRPIEDILSEGGIPITVGYVNLRSPRNPKTGTVTIDRGGINYIGAAKEGDRPMLTEPSHIGTFISHYENDAMTPEYLRWLARMAGLHAKRHLEVYDDMLNGKA